jgi:hypothetical protein
MTEAQLKNFRRKGTTKLSERVDGKSLGDLEVEERIDESNDDSYQIDWKNRKYRSAPDGESYGEWKPVQ